MKIKRITGLIFCIFLTAVFTQVWAQDSLSQSQKVNGADINETIKSFWKTNELIIGTSVVVLIILGSIFIWRKKKKSFDSL